MLVLKYQLTITSTFLTTIIKTIKPQQVAFKAEDLIRQVLRGEGYKEVLIAVSGGIDSATSATLAVRALGKENIYPVILPYGELNDEGAQDAWEVIHFLKIPAKQVITIDIKPATDAFAKYDKSMDEGRLGNVMARMRMVALYDLSKKLNRLVVGTENKTEHLLGYYTRFGDEASDIEPIRSLYKTQVYMLAEYLKIPQKIIDKSPSAGLWLGQTDEGEFGFTYEFADEVLYLHYEKNLSKSEIIKKGYNKKDVEKLWWWIEKGEFKDRLPHKYSDH